MWTQTQKIQYVARVLSITPRSVYRRMQRAELNLDQFTFPDKWVPEPPRPLPEYRPNGVQTIETPVVTGHDGQPDRSKDARPDETDPDKQTVSLPPDQVLAAIIELGEMRERVKWLSAENAYLKKEIGLLKAPPEPEEPMEDKTNPVLVKPEPQSFMQRFRQSWQLLTRGGTSEQIQS